MNATTNFDRALVLGFIGAGANGSPETRDAGPARPTGEDRGDDSGPRGRGGDEESSPLYLPTSDVRSVRREIRKDPAGQDAPCVVVDFVASDETIDTHRSIVKCDFDLTRYAKNPVLLWSHNRDKDHLPIGRCENLKIATVKGVRTMTATAVFFMRTEFQREIAEAYARGECRMFSVGFYPNKYELEEIDNEEILVLSENQLVEISATPVGSNENALSQKAFDAARQRARAAKNPAPPAPAAIPSPAPAGASKDKTTMKNMKIDVRDARADKGASCKAACPHCNEAMMVELDHLPMPDEKAVADLTVRATAAEGKLTETSAKLAEMERSLAVATQEKDAAEKRATSLETKLEAAEKVIERARMDRVAAEIDKRVGTKIEAAEKDDEIKLARTMLADTTPDPDKPGSTLGEKAWSARLAKIDQRRDLGLLGPAITGGDQKQNSGAHSAESRGLAAQVDDILSKQSGPSVPAFPS